MTSNGRATRDRGSSRLRKQWPGIRSTRIRLPRGRTVALRQRMANVENAGEWTEIRIDAVDYDVEHPPSLFTLSNLRNPRER